APDARAAIVADAAQWAGLPLDGIVTGYVTADGHVDVDLLREVADASGHRVTYHRAIERVTAPLPTALAALRVVPAVDRILTSGGAGSWLDRAAALTSLQQEADPIGEIGRASCRERGCICGGAVDVGATS